MGVFCLSIHHPISCAERVPKVLAFRVQLESQPWQKWYSVIHNAHVEANGSLSQLVYAYKEGYELLQQQWMPLQTVQQPKSHAERVPKL